MTTTVGSRKGYFATFFIPPAEDDECVFQDIVKADKEWRPHTSLSAHASRSGRGSRATQSSRTRSNSRGSGKSENTKGPNHDLGDPERDRASTARSSNSILSQRIFAETTPPPPPSRSAMRNPNSRRRHSGQPIKYAFDQDQSFASRTDRTKTTREAIRESDRGNGGDVKERTCRPYSVYTVYQKRENLAISPYGEPNLKGAAGRYREHYKSLTNSKEYPADARRDSRDYVFQRFFENLTLRASLSHRIPIGALKRPPPKPVRKLSKSLDSKTTKLHKHAFDRMVNVQKDMGLEKETKPEGARWGVEYVIAMELSHNLDKHRTARSNSLQNVPTVAMAAVTRMDTPRLHNQPAQYLTPGESSIREGASSNLYDVERIKRGPIKCIERKRRIRSPPLSKLSRDKFLPEAIRRRKMEQQDSLSGLRIGYAGANTPVTDWKSESTRRPTTTMTATTKMQLESLASKSSLDLCDLEDDKGDDPFEENDDENIDNEIAVVTGVEEDALETKVNHDTEVSPGEGAIERTSTSDNTVEESTGDTNHQFEGEGTTEQEEINEQGQNLDSSDVGVNQDELNSAMENEQEIQDGAETVTDDEDEKEENSIEQTDAEIAIEVADEVSKSIDGE